jgi:hypothetical protein
MNVEIGTGGAQFLEKEYKNGIFLAVCASLEGVHKSVVGVDVITKNIYVPVKKLHFKLEVYHLRSNEGIIFMGGTVYALNVECLRMSILYNNV